MSYEDEVFSPLEEEEDELGILSVKDLDGDDSEEEEGY
jgi:hypothetical protein